MKAPADCHSMQDLRVQIDLLDAEIVAKLAARAAYIDRAIALKQIELLPARIEDRVEQVVERVRARALVEGLDPALTEDLWRRLIEWSIAREEQVLGPVSP
ncbi:chorismate mutase [Cypionkella sp.]|jgi:isochorismate pyruvate lyase|uniref:chorismate mutase n=1 Tax=Cypionkella sp. TaxID=2811411 RepID=UPI00271E4512|nr:chorismate mutase [Cypionkella sp.]MDO8985192.1 chorismate mutase [Cypionkella sp.]MDP1578562.1 chorismate mutase [Cypionkella sp.]MDP2051692.1 chorismate mutase [Cypionkella sp.]